MCLLTSLLINREPFLAFYHWLESASLQRRKLGACAERIHIRERSANDSSIPYEHHAKVSGTTVTRTIARSQKALSENCLDGLLSR